MSFNAIATKDTLESLIEPVSALVNEMRIHLNEDGLRVLAVDPANVGMVDVQLSESAFESYSAGGGLIGVNVDKLADIVSMANAGDLVHFELNEETRKMDIAIGGLSYTMALIDPDAMREDPDIPDLELPADVTLEQSDLKRGIKAVDMVTDHVKLRADTDEQSLFIEGEGDTDDTVLELDNEDLIAADVGESVESLFSLDYLKDMTGAMPNVEVGIRMGSEFPIKMDYEVAKGEGSVEYLLAPRITSD